MGLVVIKSSLRTLERVFGFGLIESEEPLLEGGVNPEVLAVVPEGDPEPADEGFEVGFRYDEVNEEVFRLGILTKLAGASVPGR